MQTAEQNRFQNKDETARLQAAYCKGRRLSFGIDFRGIGSVRHRCFPQLHCLVISRRPSDSITKLIAHSHH